MVNAIKRWVLTGCVAAWVTLACASAAADPLIVLCYHDVLRADKKVHDPLSVEPLALVQQLAWMRAQGYHFVGLQDILDDRAGRKPLPSKPVMLTFDDGYRSVYTHVFPVLKLFRAPALVAIVGAWLEAGPGEAVDYGETQVSRDTFLSWEQIREMQSSGLVEVASHSFDSHRGVPANPQGNAEPALLTHTYDAGGYESHVALLERVRHDLRRNSDLIRDRLGRAPRVMVWPYGAYTQETVEIAEQLGMPVTLNLDPGSNPPDRPLGALRRVLIDVETDLAGLAEQFGVLTQSPEGRRAQPTRTMHVDLDYIYDPDAQRQEDNLGRLLERVKAMGASTVYLQAFADPEGVGVARALYFPNRHLPMRADLFNRVAWQLHTRAGVQVYAWMPVLGFVLPAEHPLADRLVLSEDGSGRRWQQGYRRLTPYDAAVRTLIHEIYEDLARGARFDGLLFHDDATLADTEDASDAARNARRAQGLPSSLAQLRTDSMLTAQWVQDKTRTLSAFTRSLAATVRRQQPTLLTARNLYARAAVEPAAQAWLGQSFLESLSDYDYVALMAMPYMEGAQRPQQWMDTLFGVVAAVPGALERTVFELQSVDWRNRRPLPSTELAAMVEKLHTQGARHIAYYPDDLYQDQPRLGVLKPVFSLTEQPEP